MSSTRERYVRGRSYSPTLLEREASRAILAAAREELARKRDAHRAASTTSLRQPQARPDLPKPPKRRDIGRRH